MLPYVLFGQGFLESQPSSGWPFFPMATNISQAGDWWPWAGSGSTSPGASTRACTAGAARTWRLGSRADLFPAPPRISFPLMDCYWVGSLGFNFWEINGFPLHKYAQVISPTACGALFSAGTTPQPSQSPRRTLVKPSWNPGGTLVEPRWNPGGTLPQGRPGPPWSLSGLRPQSVQLLGKKRCRRFQQQPSLMDALDCSGECPLRLAICNPHETK